MTEEQSPAPSEVSDNETYNLLTAVGLLEAEVDGARQEIASLRTERDAALKHNSEQFALARREIAELRAERDVLAAELAALLRWPTDAE